MGTCMSRCASSSQEECDIVQDKLVISQSPSLPTLPLSREISTKHTAPCSPSPSTSSFFTTSTPTTTTTTTTTTTSSITTTTSSSSCSISNEFSRGRVRDSACSSGIGLTKEKEKTSKPRKPLKFPTPPAKEQPSKVLVATPKQSIPRRYAHSQTPKKSRSSSPSLPRQRSSRNENERRSPASLPRRNLGSQSPCRRLKENALNQNPREGNCKLGIASRGLSPSPSSGRRLNSGNTCGDLSRGPLKETYKRSALCRGHSPSPSQRFNADTRRDLLRNPSEKNRRHREGSKSYATIQAATTRKGNASSKSPSSSRSRVYCLKKEESYKQHRNTECDECKQGEVVSKLEDSNSILPMEEDIDNPFISLDCFIFL